MLPSVWEEVAKWKKIPHANQKHICALMTPLRQADKRTMGGEMILRVRGLLETGDREDFREANRG